MRYKLESMETGIYKDHRCDINWHLWNFIYGIAINKSNIKWFGRPEMTNTLTN